jgi:hypothetical protein
VVWRHSLVVLLALTHGLTDCPGGRASARSSQMRKLFDLRIEEPGLNVTLTGI